MHAVQSLALCVWE